MTGNFFEDDVSININIKNTSSIVAIKLDTVEYSSHNTFTNTAGSNTHTSVSASLSSISLVLHCVFILFVNDRQKRGVTSFSNYTTTILKFLEAIGIYSKN